ncbi:MAG: DNA polymerase I [Clostridia bacterium]|nr:DNA polymerase I [Clostridia bacterium]
MKTILCVDGNSILNRAFYGIRPLTNSSGLFTHAVYGMATILQKNLDAVKPDAFAVAFDLKAPTFRHKKFDGYKANRKGMPEELAVQLPYAKRLCECMGARVLTLEGWEADDILGTLAHMADTDGEWQARILTGDRDSLQLISDETAVLLATNAETLLFDRAKFAETYGVDPSQFVDVKALMGDSSDNIPGVPGVGEKTAIKLISAHKSLDGIYAELDSPDIAKGVRAKLEGNRDLAYLSQELARIDVNAPLGVTLNELVTNGYHRADLRALFTELEFSALIKRFGLEDAGIAEAASPDEAEESAETLADIDALFQKLDGVKSAAILHDDGILSLSTDGNHVWNVPADADGAAAVFLRCDSLGVRTIVYDSKQLYSDLPLPGDCTFGVDVLLAAYVLDPSEGSYTPERLHIRYLGIAPDGGADKVSAARLYRLAEVLERLIAERGQERLLYEIEQPLAGVLVRMEKVGFKVDTAGLTEFSKQLALSADAIRERIYMYAGCEFNVNSPKQLGEVLFERLNLPHGKKTKSGYSTSADILEKLAPYYPIVGDILDWRQLTKLKSTYGDGLVKAADEAGRIHSSFNQTITATGRLSSTEPNLQNIPVRTELGREMRRFFLPDEEGRVLIDADYSQIELRILAAISGDETMIEAFKSGTDIHTVTASQAFGVPIEAVTGEMRKRAKAVNFGIVYGISDFSLAQDIGVTKKEAADYIAAYLARYPKVATYLHDIVKQAYDDGYVTTLFGRRRYIPELSSGKKMLKAFGERVAMNSPIQGTAADIIKIAMINADKALRESGLDAKLILQVHDELIVESSRADAEAACALLVQAMESAVTLDVPLTVSANIGGSWYECKD